MTTQMNQFGRLQCTGFKFIECFSSCFPIMSTN